MLQFTRVTHKCVERLSVSARRVRFRNSLLSLVVGGWLSPVPPSVFVPSLPGKLQARSRPSLNQRDGKHIQGRSAFLPLADGSMTPLFETPIGRRRLSLRSVSASAGPRTVPVPQVAVQGLPVPAVIPTTSISYMTVTAVLHLAALRLATAAAVEVPVLRMLGFLTAAEPATATAAAVLPLTYHLDCPCWVVRRSIVEEKRSHVSNHPAPVVSHNNGTSAPPPPTAIHGGCPGPAR